MLVDGLDHDPKEVVEHVGNLLRRKAFRQLSRAHQIDEQHRGLDDIPRQRGALFDSALGDVGADVSTEQVAQPVTLGQAGHHPVESRLQTPDLGSLVSADRRVDVAAFDLRHRVDDFADRIGDGARRQDHGGQAEQ